MYHFHQPAQRLTYGFSMVLYLKVGSVRPWALVELQNSYSLAAALLLLPSPL